METKKYIKLQDLEIYQLARELSKIGWEVYEPLDWQTKKIIGDQFITATDSVGANIAEGQKLKAFAGNLASRAYTCERKEFPWVLLRKQNGRFHYLDKNEAPTCKQVGIKGIFST